MVTNRLSVDALSVVKGDRASLLKRTPLPIPNRGGTHYTSGIGASQVTVDGDVEQAMTLSYLLLHVGRPLENIDMLQPFWLSSVSFEPLHLRRCLRATILVLVIGALLWCDCSHSGVHLTAAACKPVSDQQTRLST